jgi:hypothetical protein
MIIIGVDYHPEFQQIACVDTESGEFEERRLQHREEAERFYRELATRGLQYGWGWKRAAMPAG